MGTHSISLLRRQKSASLGQLSVFKESTIEKPKMKQITIQSMMFGFSSFITIASTRYLLVDIQDDIAGELAGRAGAPKYHTCPANFPYLEVGGSFPDDENHGDVCRPTPNANDHECPDGCTKVSAPFWCGENGKRCHIAKGYEFSDHRTCSGTYITKKKSLAEAYDACQGDGKCACIQNLEKDHGKYTLWDDTPERSDSGWTWTK